MRKATEDILNILLFVLLVIITAPVYYTMKLVDFIKQR